MLEHLICFFKNGFKHKYKIIDKDYYVQQGGEYWVYKVECELCGKKRTIG